MHTYTKKLITLIMVLISIAPVASFSSEASDSDSFLIEYSAVYSTVWKKGISLEVEGKQTLSKNSDNLWQFIFSAETLIASLDESSIFQVKDHQIIPIKYEYLSKVLGKERSAILTFDWEKGQVRNDVKNKPWNLAISPKTIDKLSVQLQIRQDLKLGKKKFDYQVADGGRIKNWRFERKKPERIDTVLGRVSAIKIIRVDNLHKGKQTELWFAPKFDYLLVKLEHKEDNESYTLNIDSFNQS